MRDKSSGLASIRTKHAICLLGSWRADSLSLWRQVLATPAVLGTLCDDVYVSLGVGWNALSAAKAGALCLRAPLPSWAWDRSRVEWSRAFSPRAKRQE